MLKNRQLSCIFCEDSRPEISGQTTLVGWYAGGVANMPPQGVLVVYKMCIVVSLQTPVDKPPETLRLEVRLGETTLQVSELPADALKNIRESTPQPVLVEPPRGRQLTINMEFRNLTVAEPAVLRVFAIADGEELVSNGLTFARVPTLELVEAATEG